MTNIVSLAGSVTLAATLAVSMGSMAGPADTESKSKPVTIAGSTTANSTGAIITDDARMLALELNITPQEAVIRFDGQEEFLGALEGAVAIASDRYFTSSWGQGTYEGTSYRAFASFVGPYDERIVQSFADLNFPVLVRFDAPASNDELEVIRAEAMERIWESGDLAGLTGDINPETGAIEIQAEVYGTASDLQSISPSLREEEEVMTELLVGIAESAPVDIEVSLAVGIAPEQEILYGGVAAGGCTLGFTARSSQYRGALSAAHCSNTAVIPARSSKYIYFVKEHFGSYGDAQFWRSSDTARNEVNIAANGTLRTITSRFNTGSNGIAVCNYGKTRTTWSCTTVRNWNHAFYSGGTYLSRMAQTNASFTNDGDSGGPWFYGSSAMGIHFGKSGGYSTYSRIFDVESILGVTVLTF